MITYKLTKNSNVILKNDSFWIPIDPSNTDYQAFLKWLELGNTPLPVDEV
jgi:hypothetical protein